jgi:DNA-binding transcriptional LysR family regulator
VADAVARLERVFDKFEAFDPVTSERVFRVAASDNLELYVLPKLSAFLERSAPNIDVRVSALRHDWVTSLERGEVDLKLGRKSALPETLDGQDLSKEYFSCAVRAKHPAPDTPTLREYAELSHLVVTPTGTPDLTPSTVVDALLAKRGLERRVQMTVPHFAVAPFIVASSDLALTAPTRFLDGFIKLLRLRRLELPFKVPSYHLSQVWARRSGDDAGHRWLRASVARFFA